MNRLPLMLAAKLFVLCIFSTTLAYAQDASPFEEAITRSLAGTTEIPNAIVTSTDAVVEVDCAVRKAFIAIQARDFGEAFIQMRRASVEIDRFQAVIGPDDVPEFFDDPLPESVLELIFETANNDFTGKQLRDAFVLVDEVLIAVDGNLQLIISGEGAPRNLSLAISGVQIASDIMMSVLAIYYVEPV